MVCQLHIMVQIQLNLLSIIITSIAPNASEALLEGVAIRSSVQRSVQVNVDVIIAKSPIRRHLHTSIYCRVSDIMIFNFDI